MVIDPERLADREQQPPFAFLWRPVPVGGKGNDRTRVGFNEP